MKVAEDVFNLFDLSDLPEKIVDRIVQVETRRILSLFEIKKRLSVDEVIVGLYRAHKIEKSRGLVSSHLYALSKRKLIKKVGKGLYEKC
jgi:hypothetical protein